MPTNAEHLRLQFWTEFKAFAEARGIGGLPRPTPLSRCDVLLGQSGFKVAMTFWVQGNSSGWPPIGVGCELYIDHPDAKREFGKLETKKKEIEMRYRIAMRLWSLVRSHDARPNVWFK
jgi:hypothetical protein